MDYQRTNKRNFKEFRDRIMKSTLREEDIRPEFLCRENAKLHANDVQRLLKRKNEFIKVACPACESHNYQIIFEKNGFVFVRCGKCETVFVNPRPTFDMLTEFYATSESIKYWNDKIFPASENIRRREIFKPRAKRVFEICKRYGALTDILLDVGAGFGTFCEEIKKLDVFKRIIAVEPSHSLARTCRHKGLEVIEKPFEEVNLNKIGIKEVGVITNFELIEHLWWPKDFLLSCAEMLPRGGVLILTTLNIKGFDLLVLGKLSDNMGGPNHLNYFCPSSLSCLLNRCGFEVIERQTPGRLDAELVRKKIMNGEFDVSRQPFLQHILVDEWENIGAIFQDFLADNMLSSHLWVVARKR